MSALLCLFARNKKNIVQAYCTICFTSTSMYISHICMAGMYKLMDKWNIDAICNDKMCLKNLDSIRMLQIAFKFPVMINDQHGE